MNKASEIRPKSYLTRVVEIEILIGALSDYDNFWDKKIASMEYEIDL